MSNERKPTTPQPTPERKSPPSPKPERPQPVQPPGRRIGPGAIPEHLEPSKPWPRKK